VSTVRASIARAGTAASLTALSDRATRRARLANIAAMSALHIRYTTLSLPRFPKCFSTPTPRGARIEILVSAVQVNLWAHNRWPVQVAANPAAQSEPYPLSSEAPRARGKRFPPYR